MRTLTAYIWSAIVVLGLAAGIPRTYSALSPASSSVTSSHAATAPKHRVQSVDRGDADVLYRRKRPVICLVGRCPRPPHQVNICFMGLKRAAPDACDRKRLRVNLMDPSE